MWGTCGCFKQNKSCNAFTLGLYNLLVTKKKTAMQMCNYSLVHEEKACDMSEGCGGAKIYSGYFFFFPQWLLLQKQISIGLQL